MEQRLEPQYKFVVTSGSELQAPPRELFWVFEEWGLQIRKPWEIGILASGCLGRAEPEVRTHRLCIHGQHWSWKEGGGLRELGSGKDRVKQPV